MYIHFATLIPIHSGTLAKKLNAALLFGGKAGITGVYFAQCYEIKTSFEMEKETNIILRLSPLDKKKIQEKAAESGLSLSAYSRKMLLNGNIIKADKGDNGERRTLIGVATNLNQLTRHANSTGEVLPQLNELLKQLEKIFDAYS